MITRRAGGYLGTAVELPCGAAGVSGVEVRTDTMGRFVHSLRLLCAAGAAACASDGTLPPSLPGLGWG